MTDPSTRRAEPVESVMLNPFVLLMRTLFALVTRIPFALSLSKRQENPRAAMRDSGARQTGPSTGSGRTGWVGAVIAILFACALLSCSRRTELVVFHASSLSRVLSEIAAQFEKEDSSVRVRLEPSGSQVAVRKLTELGMRADVLAVADIALLDSTHGPPSSLRFPLATNAIVLAHMDHSRFTEEVTAANWPEVLLRDGVRLGCADPALAPIGYHTEISWKLAELGGRYPPAGPDLAARLRAHCSAQIAPDETELVALLESRAVDYAFVYRTTALDHHLKTVKLP